jgi:predicted nucleic acid-binding protein
MTRVLVDTGPLVAILDRDDHEHARCRDALAELRPPLLTTWPVLTEAVWLLGFARRGPESLLEMVERGALALVPLSGEDVPRIRALMRKYRDLPMDLADASLVRAAEREKVFDVFTLDRRDFTVYRAAAGRGFRLIP